MSRSNRAYRLLDRIEDAVDGAHRALRLKLGLRREPRILPMKGFGVPKGVRVLARVLEDRGTGGGRWTRAFRRWATLEIPDARVEIRWRDRRWEARTDEEGYLDVTVPAPERVEAGWNDLRLRLVSSDYPDVTSPLRALVVGAEHDFGVISDLDDTIIDTGVSSTLALIKSWVYELPSEKDPFPGIDELYRALHRGADGDSGNPLFYVSSSPMNLYEHLERVFERHHLPEGPLLLRDWGFDHEGLSPDGGHEHKFEKAKRILEQTGSLPFVLIGDSGQHDPELYQRLVEAFPGRITAVAIRSVGPDSSSARSTEVRTIGEAIETAGVPFLATDRTEAMARFLAQRGFVTTDTIEEVRREAEHAANAA